MAEVYDISATIRNNPVKDPRYEVEIMDDSWKD